MKKTNLNPMTISILERVAIEEKIDKSSRSFLAVETVKFESMEDLEASVLDTRILGTIDLIVKYPEDIDNSMKDLLFALLSLNKLYNTTVDSKISVSSLLRDNDFNAVINSLYHVCRGLTDALFKIDDELISEIFYESDIEYVKEVLNEVHKKLNNKES